MSRRLTIPPETINAQRMASDPGLSAWVSANAGSGKTHVLSQRVIRLLLSGSDPSRILCLTYTRAAAANMSRRVFDRLAEWTRLNDSQLEEKIRDLGEHSPTPAMMRNARRLFARALETPGGLKIQTIHAFCEAVLHQFPLEANIAGHFEMLDPQMEAALLAEARREMIAGTSAPEQEGLAEAFATVLRLGGESGLESLLAEIVSRRDALARFIAEIGTGPDGHAALMAEFDLAEDESPESILNGAWPDAYFDRVTVARINDAALNAGKKHASDFAGKLLRVFEAADAEDRLKILCDAFLTRKEGQWQPRAPRNIAAKGVVEEFPELAEAFVECAERVAQAIDKLALWRMLQSTHAALVLADRLIGIYERLKSARGCLDFNDLIVRTVNLLARRDASAWVQYKLDKGIDHILLDEAQDTSPDQWAVVNALAADFFAGQSARENVPRTVFAVGDEKQSIYSFQGADPESFALSGHHFSGQVEAAGARFEKVRLLHSFRSVEDVLSAVDLTFQSEEVRQGLTRDPEPLEHKAVRQSAPGHVELWPSIAAQSVEEPDDWTQPIDQTSAPAALLAARIARTIEGWIRDRDAIEGQGRPVTAGDVLVLVRKRDSFVHALSRELKQLHVPVAGADRLSLADHIAVQDLMAIGRVVIQPDDDLSLAALLKSPVFGFSEDDLFDLASNRAADQSLLSRLGEVAASNPDWKQASESLETWRNEAGYVSPFAFYARILGRDGVRARMIARLGIEAGDVVDEFLSFCLASEQAGIVGLEALLGLLESGSPDIKREMDQARGEVRIMTTHAAKGLEAPIVFLVDSGSAPFHDSHLPRLVPFRPRKGERQTTGFLWRASGDTSNAVSRAIGLELRRKAEEEYRRLLYVGMTRAEDRLLLCGYHGKREPSEMTWHAMVSRALRASHSCQEIEDAATGETIHRYRVSGEAVVAPPEPAADIPPPSPMPEALGRRLAPQPDLPRPLAPSGVGAAIDPPLTEAGTGGSPVLDPQAAGKPALLRGTAVHRLLQRLPDIAPERRADIALAYLRGAGAAMDAAEAEATWAEVAAILDDGRFAGLFAAGSRAEISVMGQIEIGGRARAISGKIDRLLVTPDRVLLVDYKTNRPAPAELNEVPATHVAQMALYRELLRPVYPGRAVEAGLLYTAAPRLLTLSAEAMDAALAGLARA
ncbi:MAG: double-strand break repair helicase AddA [Mesorhizobium sp.]|nr:double-strand break repair helicase AddA [Mesorhizobium sp.]